MHSLRRFHKFVVLTALLWLPMSVFAQICATHALVSHIGSEQHPALIALEKTDVSALELVQSKPAVAAVDEATFWQSADDYDVGCDMKSMCTFASLSALVSVTTDVSTFVDGILVPPVRETAFSTRSLTPDTPPPRV